MKYPKLFDKRTICLKYCFFNLIYVLLISKFILMKLLRPDLFLLFRVFLQTRSLKFWFYLQNNKQICILQETYKKIQSTALGFILKLYVFFSVGETFFSVFRECIQDKTLLMCHSHGKCKVKAHILRLKQFIFHDFFIIIEIL